MKRDELEALYEQHADDLYGFLAYRTGDRGRAEELVGDTFVRALRGRSRFDRRRGSPKTWLYGIALNLLRDEIRRDEAQARALAAAGAGLATEHDATAPIAERVALMDAMETIDGQEREAIALRFGAQLTVPEIADLLGVPLTTAEGRVYRALRRLRSALEPPG